jgi:phospholipase/carboxylesterase
MRDARGPAALHEEGAVGARPVGAPASGRPGTRNLGPRGDAILQVPTSYSPGRPAPLVLCLHGAGGDARNALQPLSALSEGQRLILLAPRSARQTWDVIHGGFGEDVSAIDALLEEVFDEYAVDPEHVGIEGFSDGASYALSLGISNADLFTHVLAFSPGFMAPGRRTGAPAIFISHGTEDRTLPIDVCSRRIVPNLRHAGYDVRYEEFQGPHTVPPRVAGEAVDWFLQE